MSTVEVIRRLFYRLSLCRGEDYGGWARVYVHQLRATAATNTLTHGANIAKVQKWLGHADISTTRMYDRRRWQPEERPTFKVEC